MPIVIDINTLSCVLNKYDSMHIEFKPVHDWIIDGEGVVVYGGTKYFDELKATTKYLRIIIELKNIGKAFESDKKKIDLEEKHIDEVCQENNFNDAHLIAIIVVSGCRLLCSKNTKHFKFFKMKELYPKSTMRPKIYSSSDNTDLLCRSNVIALR